MCNCGITMERVYCLNVFANVSIEGTATVIVTLLFSSEGLVKCEPIPLKEEIKFGHFEFFISVAKINRLTQSCKFAFFCCANNMTPDVSESILQTEHESEQRSSFRLHR